MVSTQIKGLTYGFNGLLIVYVLQNIVNYFVRLCMMVFLDRMRTCLIVARTKMQAGRKQKCAAVNICVALRGFLLHGIYQQQLTSRIE